MGSEIGLFQSDVEKITIKIGNKIRHIVGAIYSIKYENVIEDDKLYGNVIMFDKIYDNFDIEIEYKNGKTKLLKDLSIDKNHSSYYSAEGHYFYSEAVIIKNIKEEDHSGQIYNPYNDTWSWL
jgi:hypothetical protein